MASAPEQDNGAAWKRDVPLSWQDGDDGLPATNVNWFDALAFCDALSVAEGLNACYEKTGGKWVCDWLADGYRLPTEAEWEYAYRGGRETPWFWGENASDAAPFAWYSGNSEQRLQSVGAREPNDFGLYDMAGNCWEWCWDRYGNYVGRKLENPRGPERGRVRVLRGGSFDVVPGLLRSARRFRIVPEFRFDRIGFRCVRSGAPALDDSTF